MAISFMNRQRIMLKKIKNFAKQREKKLLFLFGSILLLLLAFLYRWDIYWRCLLLSQGDEIGQTVSISPDRRYAINAIVENLIIQLKIYDRKGRMVYFLDSGASHVHRWSVKWLENNDIILLSSDVGPTELHYNGEYWIPDQVLHRRRPIELKSPDENFTFTTYASDGAEKIDMNNYAVVFGPDAPLEGTIKIDIKDLQGNLLYQYDTGSSIYTSWHVSWIIGDRVLFMNEKREKFLISNIGNDGAIFAEKIE